VVRQGTQGEDIGLLTSVAALGERFGRHVDRAGLLDEVGEMTRHRVAEAGHPGAGSLARGRLPVEDLNVWGARLRVEDQDVLRAQGAVADSLAMGVAQGLGDLTDEIEPATRAKTLPALREVVIQALGAREIVVDQGRAALMLGVAPGAQDPGVADAFQDGVLALGGLADGCARLLAGPGLDHIDAHTCALLLEGDVGSGPVLIARTLVDQLVEPVVPDLPRPLGLANTGLFHRPCQRLGDRAVDAETRGAFRRPARQRIDDVAAGVAVFRCVAVSRVNRGGNLIWQADAIVLGRQEDSGLEKRHADLLHGPGLPQQTDQLFRLTVGEYQGVVVGDPTPIVAPGPGAGVAVGRCTGTSGGQQDFLLPRRGPDGVLSKLRTNPRLAVAFRLLGQRLLV